MRSVFSHTAQAVAESALIALLVVGLAAGTTFAGKGGGGGKPGGGGTTSGSTLTGPVMVLDQNSNGSSNYMDDITFNVSTSATAVPTVGLRCYQGTNFVMDGYVGYYSSYLFNRWFTLGSGYWDAALSATCTARLFYNDNRGREQVLKTMTFTVAP